MSDAFPSSPLSLSVSLPTQSDADAALAAKLQAEEDAALAQRLEDERLAMAHDVRTHTRT